MVMNLHPRTQGWLSGKCRYPSITSAVQRGILTTGSLAWHDSLPGGGREGGGGGGGDHCDRGIQSPEACGKQQGPPLPGWRWEWKVGHNSPVVGQDGQEPHRRRRPAGSHPHHTLAASAPDLTLHHNPACQLVTSLQICQIMETQRTHADLHQEGRKNVALEWHADCVAQA